MKTSIRFTVEVEQVEDNERGDKIMSAISTGLVTNPALAWDLLTVAWDHDSVRVKAVTLPPVESTAR